MLKNIIKYIIFIYLIYHDVYVIFAVSYCNISFMKLRVKEICKAKGLLMGDLATTLGIARVNLTKTINGNPTKDTLERIAEALNVPISELFEQPATDTVVCPKCGTKFKMEE